jgi:hypothetical protein
MHQLLQDCHCSALMNIKLVLLGRGISAEVFLVLEKLEDQTYVRVGQALVRLSTEEERRKVWVCASSEIIVMK